MDACRDELTIAPEDVLGDRLMVAELDGSPAGFVTLEGTPPDGELGFLFVDAPFMGRGAGRTPFAAAVATAHREGFATFVVAADPDAEGFYLRMGCRRVGTIASGSIPDRRIPQLKFGLS